MYLLFHILRQIKNFVKYPKQFFKLFLTDLKKDFFLSHKKDYNKVLIVGLPKSGTTLVEWILTESGYVNQKISPLRIFYEKGLKNSHDISYKMLNFIPDNKFTFLKRHSEASQQNINLINQFKIKIILSTRNLKEAMISRYLHLISDKNSFYFKKLQKLNYIDGFRFSLTEKNDKNEIPIKEFYYWYVKWQKYIEEKKMDYLVLKYEDYKFDNKSYIKKILNYLKIKDVDVDDLFVKHQNHIKSLKNKNLQQNLTKHLHAQTFNNNFEDVKKKLIKNFDDEEFETILKNNI